MTQQADSINQALEALSAKGCFHVRQILANIKQGNIPDEITHLSAAQIDAVYQELSEVMAVYEVCELPATPA